MGGELKPVQPHSFRNERKSPWLLFKALPRVFWQASSEWSSDNAPRLGAAVAFYTLLSLAPVVVITVAVASVVYGQEASQSRLASEIRDLAGPEVMRTIEGIIKGAGKPHTGVIATLLGLATLLFGASSAFVELHDAMNTIWHVSPSPGRANAATVVRLVKNRFYSFLTVLGIGFLLLVSLVLNAGIAAMRVSVPRAIAVLLQYLFIAVLFGALYKVLPDVTLNWSDVALGAMITSLLFVAGKWLMALYFAHSAFGSTYSAAGSPIVLLLWVYYSAQLFFWGAEFSKVYKRTVGGGI